MNSPISVSQLNEQIKGILETTFSSIYVEGEISNLTYHNSGHIYFSIKDEKSTISCVMFRGNAARLKFRLEMGQKIVINGNLTVYTPRGNYQLLCTSIEPSGVGALALAYEQLKTKLQIKGYFDKSIKKILPKFVEEIYVVTSNTGAAIEDMKKILSQRFPLAKMILIPTLVQGEGAKESIVSSIRFADKLAISGNKRAIMIVGRGGGSIEDLWAFNEEIVAEAIFEAKSVIISAVGHESDFVISDFVADVRASTPSNAIEISTPDINELRIYVDTIGNDFIQKFKNILLQKEQQLRHTKKSFEQHSLARRFEQIQILINQLKEQLKNSFLQGLQRKQSSLEILQKSFLMNDPKRKDKKGFVQLIKNDIITNLEDIKKDDTVTLQDSKYSVNCKVISKETI
jgi:exodeoxyribonuclease VII large subunit